MAIVGPIIVALVILTVLAKNRSIFGRLKGSSEKLGLSNPKFLITIGIIVFNLISFTMIPWWWNILTSNWYGFAVFNIGFWLALYLRTIKNNAIASNVSNIITVMLVVGLATTAIHQYQNRESSDNNEVVKDKAPVANLSRVPADIALPIIAECESGGRQFEDDGVTPFKNREGSSAIGKYQILASEHEERALNKYGFDIRTEAGNEGYARVLYSESGTKHWEADSKSSACWRPQLQAYTGKPSRTPTQESYSLTVNAPVGPSSYEIEVPIGFDFSWGGSEGSFVVENEKGIQARFDPDNNLFEDLPWINQGEKSGFSKKLKFKSLSDKPAKVNLRFTKQSMRGSSRSPFL